MFKDKFKSAWDTIFPKITKNECKEVIKSIFSKEGKKETHKEEQNDLIKSILEYFLIIPKEKITPKEFYIARGKAILEIVDIVVWVIIALIIIKFFFIDPRFIPSASMRPTLTEGDHVIVERMSRFFTKPKRGDIMVFYPLSTKLEYTPWKVFTRLIGIGCKDIAYIKRVIGVPGDKFEIKQDDYGKSTVYINDIPLEEDYIKNPLDYPVCTEDMFCGPFIIPEKHYMMLGDNRGNSKDSRFWGLLPEERFIGKAVVVIRVAFLNDNTQNSFLRFMHLK